MKVNILRQKGPDSVPYWESFLYDGPGENSVAGVLDYLNFHDDVFTAEGEKTTRIAWECSCLQGICGACAMVINGVPALACETFLNNLREKELSLLPLRKFPVIRDLVVDRSVIQENLKQANLFIGDYQPSSKNNHSHEYTAGKCLKCGLCLEVCPNYVNGASFFGALFANDCYLVASRNQEKRSEIRRLYGKHFALGCSKALSCMDVCPMGIPTIASMAALNRR